MNNPILFIKDAGHGETPACPDAIFKRGDVVAVRNTKALAHFPREAIVAVAIPPGFSPDWALADLVGEPRSALAQVGSRGVTYILVVEYGSQVWLAREKDLTPTGRSVEIGSVKMAGAAA
jgi:hypothetical protein